MTLTIKPKNGLSDLAFGMTKEQAKACFGEAEQIEEMDAGGEFPSTVWHYWEKGFSLFFDETHQRTFSCAEIDNVDAILWNERIFKLTEKEIIDLFRRKGFTASDTEKHEWGEHRLSFDEALIDFYFEKGKLTSINFSVGPPNNPDQVLILPN